MICQECEETYKDNSRRFHCTCGGSVVYEEDYEGSKKNVEETESEKPSVGVFYMDYVYEEDVDNESDSNARHG